jgi:hypothetical protein
MSGRVESAARLAIAREDERRDFQDERGSAEASRDAAYDRNIRLGFA